MYVYLYLYDCKMYIHGYRAACLACMCTCEPCEPCESCLSLSLSRARALSLSRSLFVKKFWIVVQLSVLSRAYMQALGLISRCYKCLQQFMCTYAAYKEYQVGTATQNSLARARALSLYIYMLFGVYVYMWVSLSLSQKDALLYTSASAREASRRHAVRVETINTYRLWHLETVTPTDYDICTHRRTHALYIVVLQGW